MQFYTEAAMERAIGKRITGGQAAEILGISCRSLRRWRWRYEPYGYDGLYDRRRGKPSPRRVPVTVVEEALRLYQQQYFDLNVRHFHEKLREEHGIRLGYTWVKRALQGAGWCGRGGNAARIGSGGRDGPCRGCCCIWMGASTGGSETTAGMTCWWCWMMPPARSTTRSW
jgi:transposase